MEGSGIAPQWSQDIHGRSDGQDEMTSCFTAPGMAGEVGNAVSGLLANPTAHEPHHTLWAWQLCFLVLSNNSDLLCVSLHPSQQEITQPWVTYCTPLPSATWILTDIFFKCCYCKTRSEIILPKEKETTTEMQNQSIPIIKPKILIYIYGFKTNHTLLKPKIRINICGSKTNPIYIIHLFKGKI